MARPTALTPAIQSRFVEAIEAGASVKIASCAAGIHQATAYRWIADEGTFCEAVEAARARRVYRWLRVLEEAAGEDWKAAQWLLEHCETEDYGKSVKTAVQEEIQSFLSGLKGKLGSHAWKQVLVAASEQAGPGVVRGGAGERSGAEH